MAFQNINLGTLNQGDGDTLRSGGQKINDNFDVAVEGAASAVDGTVAIYDGTSGKLLKSGGAVAANLVTGPASSVNNRLAVFDQATGKVIKQAAFADSDVARLSATQTLTGLNTFSGAVIVSSRLVRTIPLSLGTTGNITLDFGTHALVTTGTLTGNITLKVTDVVGIPIYIEGVTIQLRIVNGGTLRNIAYDSGTDVDDWVFLGTKPTSIAANKRGVLTLTAFGVTGADVVARWDVQP